MKYSARGRVAFRAQARARGCVRSCFPTGCRTYTCVRIIPSHMTPPPPPPPPSLSPSQPISARVRRMLSGRRARIPRALRTCPRSCRVRPPASRHVRSSEFFSVCLSACLSARDPRDCLVLGGISFLGENAKVLRAETRR